jgi:hypothetical protein
MADHDLSLDFYHICIKPTEDDPPFNGLALCGRSVSDSLLYGERFKWAVHVVVYPNDTHCGLCSLLLMALEA